MIPPIPVLLIWPLIALFLFSRMRFERAFALTVIVGYLILPTNKSLNISPLPAYDKYFAISLAVFLGWLFFRPSRTGTGPTVTTGWNLMRVIVYFTLVLLLVGPVMTTLTNLEPLVFDNETKAALGMSDAVATIRRTLVLLPPLFVARACMTTETARREFLTVLVICGLIYTLPTLVELRISPQLNSWVYGYFPHEWRQHVRGGGFRPVVFLHHGLWLGFFLLTASLAAFSLARSKAPPLMPRTGWLLAGLWLLAVLAVSRNTGAAMIAAGFIPVLLFGWVRLQLRVAMAVAIVFLSYPALRQADLIPVNAIVTQIGQVMPNRARSLNTRLVNETNMLQRAAEKPLYGWGGWGRARVRDERGRDVTTLDGLWIIILSERGWVGYIGLFGLVAVPLLLLPGAARRRKDYSPTVAGMGIIVAANLVYLVPNSTLPPFSWAIIGCVVAFCQVQREKAPAPKREYRYTRFADPADLIPKTRTLDTAPKRQRPKVT